MSTISRLSSPAQNEHSEQVPLQAASLDIWDSKYRLKAADGTVLDADIAACRARVATALAALETPEQQPHWRGEFLWALEHGAIPAGRIWSNAGAQAVKPETSTINCVVSATVPDSMDGIMSSLHAAALTLKGGSGIGYDFSTLRPRGAFVRGAGSQTSGPLSFMDVFDAMCFTVSSAGGRRGAQMACMDIGHPDIAQFITAKQADGRLRQFNLSVLVRREFIDAVRADAEWVLAFPAFAHELDQADIEIIYRSFPDPDGLYTQDEQGRTAQKVYARLPARELWDRIMQSTYERAEPGFILIDEVNDLNNNWFCESIRASNPCGEQPLPPNGACLLGSVDLTHFVIAPFSPEASFDWDRYRRCVAIFTRMLDNVVEINGLPLAAQVQEITDKRRHGMGFLGLGSTLAMLGMRYGDEASVEFTAAVARELALTGWREALNLAREKGPAPLLLKEFTVTEAMLHQRPEMVEDGYGVGDTVPGRILHARYSRYMQRLAEVDPELVEQLAELGARFTHHSSIAPTGTIALSFGNNASNGIEPSFSHHYYRNLIRPGRKAKERIDVYSFELLAWRHFKDPAAQADALPECFVSSAQVTPQQHLQIQAAAQRWIDSAISKTINCPTEIPFEDFKDIYWQGAALGLKGCTTFRYNPEVFQGVLVRKEEAEQTVYAFTLADGSVVECKGSELVEYEGQQHTAANLYDAIKEGYYGRL